MSGVQGAIDRLRRALVAGDIDAAATCFAPHAELVTPEGVFVGQPEISRYWAWVLRGVLETRCEVRTSQVDSHGRAALLELACQVERSSGFRSHLAVMVSVEVDEHTRIRRMASCYDVWGQVKQIADQAVGPHADLFRRFVTGVDTEISGGLRTLKPE